MIVSNSLFWFSPGLLVSLWLFISPDRARAVENDKPTNLVSSAAGSKPLAAVVPTAKWRQVEDSVDRALAWLASQQAADGSFPTLPSGQPAVTSLCIMAFLSRGDQPGLGPRGQSLIRAIDFVLACQMPDGLFSFQPPGPIHQEIAPSHTAVYNHAIAGLMLGEVYGQVSGARAQATKQAIERALQFTRQLQLRPKPPADKGGWRYLRYHSTRVDSDLSVTGWQLMFLRSAKNAEFDVPQNYVDEATAYVRSLWDPRSGAFFYRNFDGVVDTKGIGRGMAGAGILSLSLSGQHHTPMALAAGDWLLAHPYRRYGEIVAGRDGFFYSAYYCSQAMAQLGGRYWEQFFPPLVNVLLSNQSPDGAWRAQPNWGGSQEAVFGRNHTTALAVLSLTPPYQLLPVYQR